MDTLTTVCQSPVVTVLLAVLNVVQTVMLARVEAASRRRRREHAEGEE